MNINVNPDVFDLNLVTSMVFGTQLVCNKWMIEYISNVSSSVDETTG